MNWGYNTKEKTYENDRLVRILVLYRGYDPYSSGNSRELSNVFSQQINNQNRFKY